MISSLYIFGEWLWIFSSEVVNSVFINLNRVRFVGIVKVFIQGVCGYKN